MRALYALLVLGAFAVGSTTAATAQVTDNEIRTCIAVNVPYYLHLPQGNVCANDRYLTWNRQGPAGPAGPQGSQGPQGEPGAQGPTGDLPSATVARASSRHKRAQALEAKLRKAPPGSAQAQRIMLDLLRLLREADADFIAGLR